MNKETDNEPRVVRSHDVHLDNDYVSWMADVKSRYRRAQIKAAVKVNSEQLLFNWQLGRDLVRRKAEEKWGTGIVEQVSLDLQAAFPKAKGFSARNLRNMRNWYKFYTQSDDSVIWHQLGAKLQSIVNQNPAKLHQLGADIQDDKQLHQLGGEDGYNNQLHQLGAKFPMAFAFVPWRHHVEIISKCKTIDEALFYVEKTIENGWSRNALDNCLRAHMYQNVGGAVNNFSEWLPESQSKLAEAVTKDVYDLGFLTLDHEDYSEEELEDALEKNITRFLLELGSGFAFIGRQKEIIVAGKTRRIDLLFYHYRLRAFIVCELKAKPFEPEFAGKLNFYVNAVDELLKSDDDNPTIGLLICKDKNETEVRWAFKGISTPLGVASYDNVHIQEIQKQLPTTEQLQERIRLAEEEFKASHKLG